MSSRTGRRKHRNMGISPSQMPLSPEEPVESIMVYDESGQEAYDTTGAMGYVPRNEPSAYSTNNVLRSGNIKADQGIELTGPMDIDGYVQANGNVAFNGDFNVRDKIEAYGHIDVNGHLVAQDKIKTMGNLKIYGNLTCSDKIKAYGKLKLIGTCQVHGSVEIWGAVTIQGFLSCKNLTVYGSLTTVGDESSYQVEDTEKIWGSRIFQREG